MGYKDLEDKQEKVTVQRVLEADNKTSRKKGTKGKKEQGRHKDQEVEMIDPKDETGDETLKDSLSLSTEEEKDKEGKGTKKLCIAFMTIQSKKKWPHLKQTTPEKEEQETRPKPGSPKYELTMSEEEELETRDSCRMVAMKEEVLQIEMRTSRVKVRTKTQIRTQ